MLGIRRSRRPSRTSLAAGAGALALLALSACGAETATGGTDEDTITLIAPKWVGGQANVAVAAHILSEELGYDVEVTELTEVKGWKALDSGAADAMLEDWDHPGQREEYVEKRQSVVSAGELGIKGRIGWFVPRYLANTNRGVTDWKNLNDNAKLFAPADAKGDKGQLLQGDPSYKSHDQALIDNLDLHLELKHLGSEDKQLEHMRAAAETDKPFLTYWWTPHWVESEVELAEVKLPEHYDGCDANAAKVACGYAETDLEKFVNADFDRDGGKAAAFLRNFEWSESDQNEVARLIADEGMSAKEAAAKWAADNEGIWNRWLWDLDD